MVNIVGAGMAGLLAGLMFRKDGQIYESAPSLPNNHHALLRFRSNSIGKYLNIPFKEVQVIKINKRWRNDVADAVAYSYKCTGIVGMRSSTSAKAEVETRYIAPGDFISQLERHQSNEINYGHNVTMGFILASQGDPIISTMPMPALMKILDYDHNVQFSSVGGVVVNFDLGFDTDFCSTIYYPDPEFIAYRASMTGRKMIIEIATKDDGFANDLVQGLNSDQNVIKSVVLSVLEDFGLLDSVLKDQISTSSFDIKAYKQRYAKILPIDERERKRFIMWASDNFNIYSLGRFAVWRPGLLLDDVFEDIQVIQKMIGHTNYDGRKS